MVLPIEQLRERIGELSSSKAEIDQPAPGTGRKDYETASKKIKARLFFTVTRARWCPYGL